MRRLSAILAIAGLLAAPLALLARGKGCAEECSKLYCAAHSWHTKSGGSMQGMNCGHKAGGQAMDCCTCVMSSHRAEFGVASPVVYAVLSLRASLPIPALVPRHVSFSARAQRPGFPSLPFEPPRLS